VKPVILGLAAVFGVMMCGTALAKKPPAPAPNISASISIKVDVFGEQLPPSVPIYDESVTLSLAHSFNLTGPQEAALQSDTVISLLGAEFKPGDDPNFQNGDSSAKINTQIPIGLGVTPNLPVTISVKWGKGKFTANIKGKLKTKDIAIPAPPEEVGARLLGVKALKTAAFSPRQDVPIETTIKHPSIPDLIVVANMATDVEQGMIQGYTAEGGAYIRQTVTAKSKFFAPLP